MKRLHRLAAHLSLAIISGNSHEAKILARNVRVGCPWEEDEVRNDWVIHVNCYPKQFKVNLSGRECAFSVAVDLAVVTLGKALFDVWQESDYEGTHPPYGCVWIEAEDLAFEVARTDDREEGGVIRTA